MHTWFGQDADDAAANVIADAEEEFDESDNQTESFSVTAAEAVSDENGEYAGIIQNFHDEFDDIATAAGEVMTARAILGRAATTYLLDVRLLRFMSDNDLQNSNGTGGDTEYHDENHNAALERFHGTFINGMCQDGPTVRTITQHLSSAYGIPVMYSLNATQGGFWDFMQSVSQTSFIALPYLLQIFNKPMGAQVANGAYQGYVNREKSVQSLVYEWDRVFNLSAHAQVVHFAYSQGNIISRMALQLYRSNHPARVLRRMHMVVMGSGYCWLTHRVLPRDTHFTFNMGDPVYWTVGGKYWNPLNYFNKDKWSVITGWGIDYPGDINPHIHLEDITLPNCYSWWYYYVGGPIFQISDGSIDAEKWWLHNKAPKASWWNNFNVRVTSLVSFENDLGFYGLDEVRAIYNPPWPWHDDMRDFNPTDALQEQ